MGGMTRVCADRNDSGKRRNLVIQGREEAVTGGRGGMLWRR